ncbi:MAG TPA: helix-turn-helix domain-containing protein [Terriglobales bacterium]|nr:helix-turn-helix domain-containing protein [Terriglobales bacterium]
MSEILTIDEIAALLKMPRGSVYSQTRSRHRQRYGDLAIPFFKINGSIRFRRSDVEAWIERLATQEAS